MFSNFEEYKTNITVIYFEYKKKKKAWIKEYIKMINNVDEVQRNETNCFLLNTFEIWFFFFVISNNDFILFT